MRPEVVGQVGEVDGRGTPGRVHAEVFIRRPGRARDSAGDIHYPGDGLGEIPGLRKIVQVIGGPLEAVDGLDSPWQRPVASDGAVMAPVLQLFVEGRIVCRTLVLATV